MVRVEPLNEKDLYKHYMSLKKKDVVNMLIECNKILDLINNDDHGHIFYKNEKPIKIRITEVKRLKPTIIKTPIQEWWDGLEIKPSVRLSNLLLNNYWFDDKKPFKYLEDINEKHFLQIRGAGIRLWNELLEKINGD